MVKLIDTSNKIEYRGSTGSLYKIWFTNLILKIITLGIYSFWAKVNIRKYIFSNLFLLEDNFAYLGNGKEQFKGFVKIIPIVIFAIFCYEYSEAREDLLGTILAFVMILGIIYYNSYKAMRYKLSRITYRGIRGRLVGSPTEYLFLKFKKLFFGIITFGYLIPKYDLLARSYMTNNAYFGSERFRFKGNHNDLLTTNMITILLYFPTLGFSRLWYHAKIKNYIINYTKLGDLRFEGSFTGGKYLALVFKSIFVIIFTFGIGMPFVYNMYAKFLTKNISILGQIETSKIMQNKDKISASSDELEGLLDGDAGII